MSELKIWMNGTLKSQAEAVLPVNSAAVFYGTNVFEGLRAYWNPAEEELFCFRLKEHFTRIRESMKMNRFTVPYSDADLYEAVRETLRGNQIREDVHMHMVAYVLGTGTDATGPTGLYINPRRRGRVGSLGIKCCISCWVGRCSNSIPFGLLTGANFQNGRLATLQAKADGYDAAIFLNGQGHVAEGSGATFMMVRKGRIITPPLSGDILESITRETLIEDVAPRVLNRPIIEREIDRTEVYVAEEAFFCGSGYEITPITSIDRFPLADGKVGPVTQALSDAYLALVRGADKRRSEWRTATYRSAAVPTAAGQ
jgi:branched-chain amino acid aminotransferase